MKCETTGYLLKFNPKGPINDSTAFMKRDGNNRTIHAYPRTLKTVIAECCPRGRYNRLLDPKNEEKEQ
jgi:hypothetical protein